MDRRQKIMRLIIESLSEKEDLRYSCSGAPAVSDPNLVSLDFVVRSGKVVDSINVRGLIDVPLKLKALYASDSAWETHPALSRQIDKDLQSVSDHINRLL